MFGNNINKVLVTCETEIPIVNILCVQHDKTYMYEHIYMHIYIYIYIYICMKVIQVKKLYLFLKNFSNTLRKQY